MILPSIIATTQGEIFDRFDKVKSLTETFHLDVMDGKFVPSRSLDFDYCLPEARFEAHLMVEDPDNWIDKMDEKIGLLFIHVESCRDPKEMIAKVKQSGRKIGFVINPETEIKEIEPYLDDIDSVLVMTVHPGFYGAGFMPEEMEKIRELRKLRPDLDIEADGSINEETIAQVSGAGANRFVCGSYLQKAEDPKKAYDDLLKQIV